MRVAIATFNRICNCQCSRHNDVQLPAQSSHRIGAYHPIYLYTVVRRDSHHRLHSEGNKPASSTLAVPLTSSCVEHNLVHRNAVRLTARRPQLPIYLLATGDRQRQNRKQGKATQTTGTDSNRTTRSARDSGKTEASLTSSTMIPFVRRVA